MPDYFTVIERPMDFSKIHEKVSAHEYDNLDDLQADFNLMCNNALLYNAPYVHRPRLRTFKLMSTGTLSTRSLQGGYLTLAPLSSKSTAMWLHRVSW